MGVRYHGIEFSFSFAKCHLLLLLCSSGDEHRELKLSQFVIKEVENPSADSEMIKCIFYIEHGSKSRPGLMHHVHLENKTVVHYAILCHYAIYTVCHVTWVTGVLYTLWSFICPTPFTIFVVGYYVTFEKQNQKSIFSIGQCFFRI